MRREVTRALRLYAFFVTLYPRQFKQAFGGQMLQTFKDHYSDRTPSEHQAHFWFAVVSDELRGILREHCAVLKGKLCMQDDWMKQGLFFGIVLGIAYIGYDLINNLAPASTVLNGLLNNSMMLAVLIFSAVAGYVTASKTGQLKNGIYAGLLAGLLSMLIGIAALLVITFLFLDIIRHNAFMIEDFHRSGLKDIDLFIVEDALGGAFIGTFFSLLAGGIFGTIGGYLGKTLKGLQNDER